MALKHEGEHIHIVPDADEQVRCGDHLVVIGDQKSLEKLAQLAQVPDAPKSGN